MLKLHCLPQEINISYALVYFNMNKPLTTSLPIFVNLRGRLVERKILVSQNSEIGKLYFPCLVYLLKK